MSQLNSAIFEGEVSHKRLGPRLHRLRYRVFTLLLDLGEIDRLDHRLKLFSRNRFNLFSFFDKDYGDGGGDIDQHIRGLLRDNGLEIGRGRIALLCYPRVLGYVFNPLSVYFCYGEDGALRAINYEVSNTFGERHSYLIPAPEEAGKQIHQKCAKALHVSPFLKTSGSYAFQVEPPGNRVRVGITYRDGGKPMLKALFRGLRRPLSDRQLLAMALRYPLVTWKVIGGIHFEALRIWLKGVRAEKRQPTKPYAVSFEPANDRGGER